MNEAPTVVEIVPVDIKLNVPEESFGGNLKAEPKKKWSPFKKSDKSDKDVKIVHEIVHSDLKQKFNLITF